MEKPSSSDPNFKAFLNKLKEQNSDGGLIQKDTSQNVNNTKDLGEVRDSLKQGLLGVNENLVKVQDRIDTANKSLSKIAAAIQGNALDRAVEVKNKKEDKEEDKEEVDNFDPSIRARIKSFITDGASDRLASLQAQKPATEVVKKEREDKVSSPREVNPEADNINTSAEIQADAAKKDLELSKEMLDTTKEELTLLKEIKDALAPKTPAELGDSNTQGLGAAAGAAIAPETSSSPGVNIDLPVPGLPDKKGGKPGKPGKETGKAVAKGVGKSLLKKIPVIGAVAGLAYGASRAMSGDFAGAGMEVASGLAGTIPGVGTAASVGIDAALAAKDAGMFDKEQTPAPTTTPATAPVATAPVKATAQVATASTSLGGAIAATAAPAATKSSKGTSSFKGSENLEKLQIAEGELQGLYSDLRDEKGKLLEKFVNDRKRFPGGVPSDPSDPDYPKELKAIDDKYQKQIDAKKKEVSELGKAPGISEAKKAAKDFDDDLDKGFSDEAPAKSVSKVTGGKVKSSEFSITSTQSVETVTGGETTTKRVLTDDAKKAEAELTGMSSKHTAERKQVVDKLKSEGKITGRFATDEDYQQIPELKDLKAKQDAERGVIAKRVDKGTSTDVSKVSIDNATMRDEMSASRSDSSTVVSNNISSNNTTKFVPIKSSPRAENTGSALDRYTSRITTY